MKFGTVKMTPEFMAEMDAMAPKRGKTLQMSATTDGSDVSRKEVEAEVCKLVQARKDGKCKVMKSFLEEPRARRNAQELIDSLRG